MGQPYQNQIDDTAIPEEAIIEISRDKMEANIRFKPPRNKGHLLSRRGLEKVVTDAGVKYGIIEGVLDKLAENRDHETSYPLARGILPISGTDGYINYLLDFSKKDTTPKILENGKADYHKLGLIVMVEPDQPLATSVPPAAGSFGTNVFGERVPCKPGRQAPRLPLGKNTYASKDATTLYSSSPGQAILKDNKISVLPVLDIAGDVDNSTGDIEFNGAVIVRGGVLTDFSISARGDVEVHGVVEGARITSDSNIVLFSGIQGVDKAVLKAAGNINAKFATNCTLEAEGNIVADSILHSSIKCGGALELVGKNGKLVGGTANVKDRISAKEIGSPMATVTTLEVGHDPDALDKYKALMTEFNAIKKDYDNLNKIVDLLKGQNETGELTGDKKNYLLKIIHTKVHTREKLTEMQKKINGVKQFLGNKSGVICATDVVRPGVKVLIGDAMLYVRDDIVNCKLTNDGSRIVVGSLV